MTGRYIPISCLLILALLAACIPGRTGPVTISLPLTSQPSAPAAPSVTLKAPIAASSPFTASPSPVPTVERLKATVTANLLSCRYGPGPNYLFLYGLRKGANIVLIGRTNGENWHWVYVQGRRPCWVKTDFLDVHGQWLGLPVVYPGLAKLPVSPYYPPTTVLHIGRQQDRVTIQWLDIPLRAGDEEDAYMQHYIVEVWHCQNGHLLFEPLATNDTSATFIDQSGCKAASHGRIFVQEKHGFAGPAEIPWPAH